MKPRDFCRQASDAERRLVSSICQQLQRFHTLKIPPWLALVTSLR